MPWPVVDYLAEPLGIGDASQVEKYAEQPKTTYEHAWMIRDGPPRRSWRLDRLALGRRAGGWRAEHPLVLGRRDVPTVRM